MSQIHELILLAKGEVVAIPKAGKVPCGGASYAYRKIDDVVNKVCPIFDRHKIVTTMACSDITSSQQVEEKKNTQGVVIGIRCIDRVVCKVTVTLTAPDGSSIECSGVGEGVCSGDGTAAKKAMAAGWKYAVATGLGIPFDIEDDEQNGNKPQEPPADKPKTPSLSQMLSGEPTATTTTTATTAAANEPDPRADAMEVNVNDPCLPHQRAKVIELWEKLGRTKDQLREAIANKGKAKLADLTVAEASQFIEALCKKLGIANCPF